MSSRSCLPIFMGLLFSTFCTQAFDRAEFLEFHRLPINLKRQYNRSFGGHSGTLSGHHDELVYQELNISLPEASHPAGIDPVAINNQNIHGKEGSIGEQNAHEVKLESMKEEVYDQSIILSDRIPKQRNKDYFQPNFLHSTNTTINRSRQINSYAKALLSKGI